MNPQKKFHLVFSVFKEIATVLHDRHEITHPTIQIDLCRIDHGCMAPKSD